METLRQRGERERERERESYRVTERERERERERTPFYHFNPPGRKILFFLFSS